MCRPDQKKVYGVARNEAAHILCEVDAFPPPEAFKWSFNNTAETLDMPQSGFEKHSPRASKLTYIPIKVYLYTIYIYITQHKRYMANVRRVRQSCRRWIGSLHVRVGFYMLCVQANRHDARQSSGMAFEYIYKQISNSNVVRSKRYEARFADVKYNLLFLRMSTR